MRHSVRKENRNIAGMRIIFGGGCPPPVGSGSDGDLGQDVTDLELTEQIPVGCIDLNAIAIDEDRGTVIEILDSCVRVLDSGEQLLVILVQRIEQRIGEDDEDFSCGHFHLHLPDLESASRESLRHL
jgi:hypothetical protein